MVAAGNLRERVTIQTATSTKGALGGLSTSWVDAATVWARVEQKAAAERTEQAQVRDIKMFKVTVRRRPISATENRLVWQGRRLAIVGVIDDEAREVTILTCEEGRGADG